ncbi:MAG TPA: hypothetical protein VGC77_07020 [Rhodopseudomonas sp.]|uniref:hypothetical protein n=1 Tax=Rhodopseudomonas sp. TaxID=1078 RepID=UPI002EDA1545
MAEALAFVQIALRALLVTAAIGCAVVGVVMAARYLADLSRVRPRIIDKQAARLPLRRPPGPRPPHRKRSEFAWRHGSVDLPDKDAE